LHWPVARAWNYFDFDPKTRFSPSDLFLNILFSTVAGGVTGKIAQGTAITMVEEFDKAIENMYSIIIAVDATTWGNNFINLMKDCRWLIRESSVPPIQE